MRLEIRTNQYPVRLVVSDETPGRVLSAMRAERARFKQRLRNRRWYLRHRERILAERAIWRKENRDRLRAYDAQQRSRPGSLKKRRAQKRRWRELHRDDYNAYYRRYDATKPGRREYKAKWARDKRSRDRAAKAQP